MTHVEIGTVSHGTMRSEDLLASLGEHLRTLDSQGEYAELCDRAESMLDLLEQDDGEDDRITLDAMDVVDELFDALDAFSPEGCYFGAHEGDGADYGFWPIVYQDDCEPY